MDYNWFFSSISQCAAAIAGFFGAFIITKIISRDSEYSVLIRRISIIKADIEKQKADLNNCNFKQYNNTIRAKIFKSPKFKLFIEKITNNNDEGKLNSIIYSFKFSPFENLEQLKNQIKKRLEKKIIIKKQKTNVIETNNDSFDDLNSIKEEITTTEYLIGTIKSLLSEIESFPKDRNTISISLFATLLIFLIGIIYPLHFLPQTNTFSICLDISCLKEYFNNSFNSFQFALLLIFTVIFLFLIGLFYKKNKSHVFNEKDIEHLNTFIVLENYSVFLLNNK